MNETQYTIGQWTDQTFPGTDPDSPRKALRALEEMVELCEAFGATREEIVRTVFNAANPDYAPDLRYPKLELVPPETADVQTILYGIAHMRNFSLAQEVNKKMAINRARKWKTLGDGTGYHIKD